MLDIYIRGRIERISPEAPVPVLIQEQSDAMAGGIGNVVANLNGLGAKTTLISVIGDDKNGIDLQNILKNQPLICDPTRPTTTKTRYLESQKHLMRLDTESLEAVSTDIEMQVLKALEDHTPNHDAIILSDYKKGVLTPNICQSAIALAKKHTKPILIDPKGTDYTMYRGAHIITPNLKNLADATNMPVNSDHEIEKAAMHLIKAHDFKAIIVTKSEKGMSLVQFNEDSIAIPAHTKNAIEVSGAGDTVMAVLGASIAVNHPPQHAMETANIAAGIVVAESGSCIITADKLRKHIS